MARLFPMTRPTVAAAIACSMAATFTTPVRAADPNALRIYSAPVADVADGSAVTLSFDSGLLTTPDGIGRVHREIGRAARRVCAAYLGTDTDADQTACRADAVADALSSLSVIEATRETLSEVAEAP